jgi:hypothetical protein
LTERENRPPLAPLAALEAVDGAIAAAEGDARRMLRVFRERLIGEMVGDLDRILRTITPGFSFVGRAAGGDRRVIAPGEGPSAMFAPLCERDDLGMWSDWDHLLVHNGVVAGDGRLHISCSASTAPRYGIPADDPDAWYVGESELVVFVDFEDGRMAREVMYSDPSTLQVAKISLDAAPRREILRAEVG